MTRHAAIKGSPTRGELRLAQKEAREACLERDAALLELERAQKLLAEGAVDELRDDRDEARAHLASLRGELGKTNAYELLALGREGLARWLSTLAESIP